MLPGLLLTTEAAVKVGTTALHFSVHTLILNAARDVPCNQECSLLLHAVNIHQTGEGSEMHRQLLGSAALLQNNTISTSQLDPGPYELEQTSSHRI
ncbi:hypothetical protein WJX75_001250 [Coccomyxa subellipsoidea]|uniref:Uncharacterized protein n=1 Tax=Coccomyxa subellipsoidea TaxID=248742 RepID=A0ABR2YTA3_9CHLO